MSFNRLHTIDLINAFCRAQDVNESNFIACTYNAIEGASIDQIKALVEDFNTPLAGCYEWSMTKGKAKGWHFHFVTHKSHTLNLIKQGVYIVNGYDLQGWIAGYICKPTPHNEKQHHEVNKINVPCVPPIMEHTTPIQKELEFNVPNVSPVMAQEIEPKEKEIEINMRFVPVIWFLPLFIRKTIQRIKRKMLPPIRPAPTIH